ncbi:hypothetical protein D3C80_486970 [compost metagenome]
MDALLAGLALADVAEEADVADQVAVFVLHGGDADPGRVVVARPALEPDLAFPAAALVELADDVVELVGLLAVGGEHRGQLVQHLAGLVAGDAAEGLVDLDDVAGRVGDQDGRGGMLEHRGRHAHVLFRTALLADVAADAEHALEAPVFVPHQHGAQFHRDLLPVGAHAVEEEQPRRHLAAQLGQALGVAQGVADLLQLFEQGDHVPRVGGHAVEAVGEGPVDAVAEHRQHRGANVVELEFAVGGEDHVADAFGQHAVAAFALTHGFGGFDLLGDVLGDADQPAHPALRVADQGLLADIEPVPAAVLVPPAQLALQQQAVAHHLLQAAHAPVLLGVIRVQDVFPEALAHAVDVPAAVTQLLGEAVVGEHHPLADDVVHIEGVGHRQHHVGPEPLALDQRELDRLAAGDVVDAEGDGVQVLDHVRQVQHQPDVPLPALGGDDAAFHLQLLAAAQQGRHQLETDAALMQRAGADQLLPCLLGVADLQEAHGHLVDLGDAQLAQQLGVALRVGLDPGSQARPVAHALVDQVAAQVGQVEHAEGDAAAFEDVLVAPPGFLQHAQGALLLGHVAQHPDVAEQLGAVVEVVAGHRQQALFAAVAELHQVRAQLLAEAGGIQQQRVEPRQQRQQVVILGRRAADAEQALGLGVEVAEAAVDLGHQNPLLDHAEGAGGLAQGAPRGVVELAQAALFALQVVERDQRQAGADEEQQQLAQQFGQQAAAHLALVVEGADLPVAVLQGRDEDGLPLLLGGQRHDDGAGAVRLATLHQDALEEVVLQQPAVVAVLVLEQPGADGLGVQAQGPVAARFGQRRLAQDQVHLAPALGAEGEVVDLAFAALDQAGEEQGVVAVGLGVGQHAAIGVEPGEAAQRGQDRPQQVQRDQALVFRLCGGRLLAEEGEYRVGLHPHDQFEVAGQLAGQGVVAIPRAVLQLAVLLLQLPEQQGQHQQHQAHQQAFDRAACRSGGRPSWLVLGCGDGAVWHGWRSCCYDSNGRWRDVPGPWPRGG